MNYEVFGLGFLTVEIHFGGFMDEWSKICLCMQKTNRKNFGEF